MVLVALLMGNVASLRLSEDEVNKEIGEPSTSFHSILNESFGKISEVPLPLESSPQEHDSSTAAPGREMTRILHLSLEEVLLLTLQGCGARGASSSGEGSHWWRQGRFTTFVGDIMIAPPSGHAMNKRYRCQYCRLATTALRRCITRSFAFYLKYCQKCLDLVLVGSTGASVVLSTETLSGARDGEVRHRRRVPQEIDFRAGRIVDGGNLRLSVKTDCERHPEKDAASPLSDERAWQYCCQRLLAFPLTFAVYRHFRSRGYTVHSGQKYGAHFVLYEGSPDEVHSRYCVHVMGANGGDSWGHMKTMSRLMPDIAKSLLVCGVSYQAMDRDRSLSRHFPPLDTRSLQALDVAKVEVLSLSRLNDSEHTLNFGLDTPGHGHIGGLSSGLGARGGGGAGKPSGSETLKKKWRGTSKPGGVK